MQDDDQIRLHHMLDAALDACQFIKGRSLLDLEDDRMLLYAVIRCIEVIGEAAGEVSHELRTHSSHIPWGGIVSMRNRLIHGYFDVDTKIVWQTVTEELPVLIIQIRSLLGC
ncbi:MAG: DUF86 domain-containing protein [Magnetococcus sp. DMHC-1]|nr:DUF86 domain-containing protein [Magnetococcales bacterium]